MASFRGHLTFSSALGIAYGGLSYWQLHVDWPLAAVAGMLTAVGGLLPDLDSDSGVPVREMFNLAATITPLILLRRIASYNLSMEEMLLLFMGTYLIVRFGVRTLFKHLSVHRGMYHSVPAMLIAGLMMFLGYHHPNMIVRGYLSVAVMVGFLSHLVLDEICAVDFRGLAPKLNAFAGTALKLYSKSWWATLVCYGMLGGLGWLAYRDVEPQLRKGGVMPAVRQGVQIQERPEPPDQFRWGPRTSPSPQRPDPPALSVPGFGPKS